MNAFKACNVIKSLLSCTQNSADQPELVNHKGNVLTDFQTISESFNSYFSTISLDLTTKYNGQNTNAFIKFHPLPIFLHCSFLYVLKLKL